MPELYSRMDSVNWLTPAIADILDQGANPPGGTGSGSIREHMLTIQRELSDLETPSRIVNVRSSPSYHLFVARPEMIGKMGNRRQVSPDAIEKSIEKIAENHPDWTMGFMPTLKGEDNAVGILLRTSDHRPQSLRRLLVRDTFRKHPHTTAFTAGITLEQQVIIRDLAEIGHLLVVGKESAKQHIIQGIVLTLTLLNTPGELRLALAGDTAKIHKVFAGIPHALGRLLPDAPSGQRLLQGLVKEVQRRHQAFQDENVRTLHDYNERQREKQRPELPRILMVLDALSDSAWQPYEADWMPPVIRLIQEGSKAGIHLLIAVDELNAPEHLKTLQSLIHTRLVLRPAAREIFKDAPMHRSQLRFIDAFVLEGRLENRKELRITPVEICAISGVEIKRAIEYWRGNARQRLTEATSSSVISGRTGVTGILRTPEADLALPKPPVPEKPKHQTLERAALALKTEVQQSPPVVRSKMPADDTVETMIKQLAPDEKTVEISQPDLSPAMDSLRKLEVAQTVEAPQSTEVPPAPVIQEMPELTLPPPTANPTPFEKPPLPETPSPAEAAAPAVEVPVSANGAKGAAHESRASGPMMPDLINRACALAAYLGWVSPGALQDIFGLSEDEARGVMNELRERDIIETTDAITPRFRRLIQQQEEIQ